jgi:regulator of sirC expression with transglutaminase-like and TPR domain
VGTVNPTARFALIVGADVVELDEAAFAIAQHAFPDLDPAKERARLDQLASLVREPTRAGLCRIVFGELGLRGNTDDYYDPDNSFLNRVLDTRRGIPISIAAVMIEVGRRCGVPLSGLNAPTHFLVRDDSDGTVLDPFAGGAEVHGVDAPLAGTGVIVGRMLNNLRSIYVNRGDLANLLWVLELRTLLPGAPADAAHELTRARARLN